MNWNRIFYRIQQTLILLLHLILLGWIYHTLSEAGTMQVTEAFLHFLGMGLYGALLIFGTATWAKRVDRNERLEK